MSQLDVFRLDGRVAFVSGGGGAIGSALALALVVLLYRYQGTLDANAYRMLKDE